MGSSPTRGTNSLVKGVFLSRSIKKPFIKDKNKFMQKYYNRCERRRAKQALINGDYDLPTHAIMSRGSYDICDFILSIHDIHGFCAFIGWDCYDEKPWKWFRK